MFLDNENISMRLKIVEDRLGFIENLTQLQDKRINELTKQLDHVIHQFQGLNLDRCRNDEGLIFKIERFEKSLVILQREMNQIATHQDERINQLINQLVGPSFKDIDIQIKQESQRLQLQCQRQLDEMYEEIINKFKTPLQSSVAHGGRVSILESTSHDDTKKKIDDEINRRISEENEKRKSFIESDKKQHKNGQLSTEKSRAREIQNRLNLERKAKQDKINQLNELYQFRKH
ncbi:unnamed protein product [Paramecium pentaurelia]|uniref:Uncharacterized protein n=1 Tax=Paramecium pentaurelia TaxID=43138 RepID=A0A8S1UD98_9CILI|nr:unnamed protein product [Paramecium pentaurelia]